MRSPNFDRLNNIVFLEDEPNRVPFYEPFADRAVMEAVTGEPMTKLSLPRGRVEIEDAIKHDLKVTTRFHFKLDYDHVPLIIPCSLPKDNVIYTDDTAVLSRP